MKARRATSTTCSWTAAVGGLMLATGCSMTRPAAVAASAIDASATVAEERVAIACGGKASRAQCVLDAGYRLDAPANAAAQGRELKLGVTSMRAALEIDGGGRERALTASELRGASIRHESLGIAVVGSWRVQGGVALQRPGSVRVRGRLQPEPDDRSAFSNPAPVARHPVMARLFGVHACVFDREGCVYTIFYQAAGARPVRLGVRRANAGSDRARARARARARLGG